MKELLLNRGDVVIVSDSAKIPYYSRSNSFRRSYETAFAKVTPSKGDARWQGRCSPAIVEGRRGRDDAVSKPFQSQSRRNSASRKRTSGLKPNSSKGYRRSTATSALQDTNKAQSIIQLVQSLAMRAAITVRGPREKNAARTA